MIIVAWFRSHGAKSMILRSWKTYWKPKNIVKLMDIPDAMTMGALTTTHSLACQWLKVLINRVYVFSQGAKLMK
jgi:hypothetical protein